MQVEGNFLQPYLSCKKISSKNIFSRVREVRKNYFSSLCRRRRHKTREEVPNYGQEKSKKEGWQKEKETLVLLNAPPRLYVGAGFLITKVLTAWDLRSSRPRRRQSCRILRRIPGSESPYFPGHFECQARCFCRQPRSQFCRFPRATG